MSLSPDELHHFLELAAEKTAESLLCVDTDGKILHANEAAARTLGHSALDLLNRTIFQIAPEMNPPLWNELWKEMRNHSSFAFEFTLAGAEERVVQVDVSAHYLKPAKRELACIFFRDIEERKRLKNIQEEFVSTASHELRTPMTVIREGVSQVLEGLRGDLNDGQKRALTLALGGIDRLSRIIEDLLDISKIESGKVKLRRERLDLCALARDVGANFQSLANDRGLDLRISTPAGAIIVYADHDRLIQVLTNLIGNAFKFTEKGRIEIAITAREGEVECSVIDTGMGLASGDLEKVFNKFEQVGHAAVTGEKGTGLGLSISRGIVELHKGRIWAESAGPGKGARIAFIIPRQTGADVFREQLAPMLKNVARRGGSLSTVVFHIDEPVPAALSTLESLMRKHSGRQTNVLVKDVDTVYLALESTVKREAVRVAEKVLGSFREAMMRDELPAKLHISFRVMGYPEEAGDEDSYLNRIFSQEAA